MKLWAAVVANFFFPGAGYLLLGQRAPSAALWLLGVVGLTWVELSLQAQGSGLYWPMFASVFAMNTGFAIDTWRGAQRPAPAM
jgi:hypothetical protein